MNQSPEFDQYSKSYAELLKNPLRDQFAPDGGLFFHTRKRDMILEHFQHRGIDTRELAFLDVGCGTGILMTLLQPHFASVAGCDPSAGMLETAQEAALEIRMQTDPLKIPFDAESFDFMSAVCVFHHVAPAERLQLLSEMRRVLKLGGTMSIIEHNPYNPVTQWIVRHTPVDQNAILLYSRETRGLLGQAGLSVLDQRYFLYCPERVYKTLHPLESALSRTPLGGQYIVFGCREPGGTAPHPDRKNTH